MTETNENSFIVNTDFDTVVFSNVFKRTWYWFPLIFAVCGSLAFLYLRYTKPIFESKTILQITQTDQSADVLNFQNINTQENLSKEIELLRSEFLFQSAIKSLNLEVSHFAQGEFLLEERYLQSSFKVTPFHLSDSSLCNTPIYIKALNNKRVKVSYQHKGEEFNFETRDNSKLNTPHFEISIKTSNWDNFLIDSDKNELYFMFNELQFLTRKMLPNLNVIPLNPSAKTIEISYQSNNAFLSRDVTQAVAKAFLDNDESLKKKGSDKILNFLSIQLDSLQQELKNSQDSIMAFQKNQDLFNPDALSSNMTSKLNTLNEYIFKLQEEKRILLDVKNKIDQNPDRLEVYRIIPIILGGGFNTNLSPQVEELHRLLERKEDLLFNITPDNSTIATIERRIKIGVENIHRTLDLLNERAEEKEEVLKKQIQELQEEFYTIPEKQIELNRLTKIQSVNEKYYNQFFEKQILYTISNAGYTSQTNILKPAQASEDSISPQKSLSYAVSGALGFIISLALLLIRYVSYNEINSLKDIEKKLPQRVGVLGDIPLIKNSSKYSQLDVVQRPKSRLAESIRTIRTNLSFVQKDIQTIAISSSISGEGKTFVALNLAGIIAMSGKKTIIIDIDMRKPKVHFGLNAENNQGMSNILSGQLNIQECIQETELENLHFITAGPIPPNPSELLIGKNFENALQYLKEEYDTIIIDNPPVGLVSDGVRILSMADVPIFVFKANYSKRFFIKRLENLTKINDITNINVILNGVNNRRDGYGHKYGYGGYYEDELSKKNIFNFWKKSN